MNKEPNKDLMELLRAAETTDVVYTAEHVLLAEIVKRAVWDAFGSFKEGKQGSQWSRRRCAIEAQNWLWDEGHYPWGYRWICEHINISPDILLNQIEAKLLLGEMVEELREPLNLSKVVQNRLAKKKKELNEKGIKLIAVDDLSGSVWGELFQGGSSRSKRATWPDD